MDIVHLKKRFLFLAVVLLLISVPLTYTLHESVLDIQMRSDTGRAKRAFDVEGSLEWQHLTTVEMGRAH